MGSYKDVYNKLYEIAADQDVPLILAITVAVEDMTDGVVD